MPKPGECEIREKILDLHSQKLSTRSIAEALNESGQFNRSGEPWASASIARIVKAAQLVR